MRFANDRKWNYELHEEICSGKRLSNRPVLIRLLARLSKKEADALLVYSAGRITRHFTHGVQLFDRAKYEGWKIHIFNMHMGEVVDDITFQHNYFEELRREVIESDYKRRELGIEEELRREHLDDIVDRELRLQ